MYTYYTVLKKKTGLQQEIPSSKNSTSNSVSQILAGILLRAPRLMNNIFTPHSLLQCVFYKIFHLINVCHTNKYYKTFRFINICHTNYVLYARAFSTENRPLALPALSLNFTLFFTISYQLHITDGRFRRSTAHEQLC